MFAMAETEYAAAVAWLEREDCCQSITEQREVVSGKSRRQRREHAR